MICLLTEHRIVLSQAEQFDVLDFTKRLLKTYFRLSYLMEKYMGLVKVHLYHYFYANSLVLNLNDES